MFIDAEDDPNAPGPSSGPPVHPGSVVRPDVADVAERHAAKARRRELKEKVRLLQAELAALPGCDTSTSGNGQPRREYQN